MRKHLPTILLNAVATFLVCSVVAWATNTTIGVTAGSGTLANLISFASTHVISEIGICDATTENQCGSVSAAGAVKVDNSAVTQPVSGTIAATQSGTWTVNPTTIGNWGLVGSTQNSTTPTNGQLAIGQFNTTPTTITTGNVSPLQLDANGNLLVNIKAGAGSGGTALTDEGTFTQGTTSFTPSGCFFNSAITNLTSGQGGSFQCTNDRNLFTNVNKWAGSALGAMANYGTSPGAVLVPGVNAFITNANANGQTTASGSSPVVLASNQSVADPCTFQAKSNAPFATTSATNVQLVAGVSAKKVYICSLSIVVASAASFNVIEGTGAACTTANEAAIIGSTTTPAGMAFAANGGMTYGNGNATVGVTATAANGICILTNTASSFSGNITFLQQ